MDNFTFLLTLIVLISVALILNANPRCPYCHKRFKTKYYNEILDRWEWECDNCGYKKNMFDDKDY